jgi:hypothetical protein
MRNKLLVLFLIAISSVVIFPTDTKARTTESDRTFSESKTEPLFQRRRGRYRRQNRRQVRRQIRRSNRYQNRRYRNYRRSRIVRQYYWRNGRRYVRYVRVYY